MYLRTATATAVAAGRVLVWLGVLLLAGCASTSGPEGTAEQGDFMSRARTQVLDRVTVTAAVPDADEARELFGAPLYRRGIQPVWLEIRNDRDAEVRFLPVGLDPVYYSPIESAFVGYGNRQSAPPSDAADAFFRRGMGPSVAPGETRSGFVFSRLKEGTKSFNVDIIDEQGLTTSTFFIRVPGLRIDHQEIDWDQLYPPEQYQQLSEDELIAMLERHPCCVTDQKGENQGDPINFVLIGNEADVYYAFIRAGWDETETIYGGSAWRMLKAFASGSEYRYSPVSALYTLGRSQDVAFQRARSNINERNHLRLWMTPYLHQGKRVWLGQISRDIGVRLTRKTITTHKIDPNVDETREYLLENLAYAQMLRKIGYVAGVGAAPIEAPRANLTGDPYFTDGLRAVLFLSDQPMDIADIEVASWRVPPDRTD
jgi:hypothetical protein